MKYDNNFWRVKKVVWCRVKFYNPANMIVCMQRYRADCSHIHSKNIVMSHDKTWQCCQLYSRHTSIYHQVVRAQNVSMARHVWKTVRVRHASAVKTTSGLYVSRVSRYLCWCKWEEIREDMRHHHGPLTRYINLWVTHARGMPGTFFPATAG